MKSNVYPITGTPFHAYIRDNTFIKSRIMQWLILRDVGFDAYVKKCRQWHPKQWTRDSENNVRWFQ
jgi:hypothetical protein